MEKFSRQIKKAGREGWLLFLSAIATKSGFNKAKANTVLKWSRRELNPGPTVPYPAFYMRSLYTQFFSLCISIDNLQTA